jgi:hypothetical protein
MEQLLSIISQEIESSNKIKSEKQITIRPDNTFRKKPGRSPKNFYRIENGIIEIKIYSGISLCIPKEIIDDINEIDQYGNMLEINNGKFILELYYSEGANSSLVQKNCSKSCCENCIILTNTIKTYEYTQFHFVINGQSNHFEKGSYFYFQLIDMKDKSNPLKSNKFKSINSCLSFSKSKQENKKRVLEYIKKSEEKKKKKQDINF